MTAMAEGDLDELRARAGDTLRRLSVNPNVANLTAAKGLVESLRNMRDYPTMGRLAEAVSRVDPKDPKNRRRASIRAVICPGFRQGRAGCRA